MRTKQYKLIGALALAVCTTVGMAACGGDDDPTDTPASEDGGSGGEGGDAVAEYCASVDELADKLSSGDSAAITQAQEVAAKAAQVTTDNPDAAAEIAECSAQLAEAMTP